jgi:acyl-CoA thioesterase YciA
MTEPRGKLELRTLAMPANTNPSGDIFGGYIMSLMDLAAGMSAGRLARGRVVTAAASNLAFLAPVKIGDIICCYAEVLRTGRTSITLAVEAWVLRRQDEDRSKVTQAEFTMVAVDEDGRPKHVHPT